MDLGKGLCIIKPPDELFGSHLSTRFGPRLPFTSQRARRSALANFGRQRSAINHQVNNMKLIGYAFSSGRIDFTREDNPWAFSRIDSGMKQSQKDRIRVDPTQALVELRSAPINGDEAPDWMEHMEMVLRSADSLYLQYKSGVLRFRRANHDANSHRTFITLGNQDEFDLYAKENWQNIRYLYAQRRNAICFDINTMFSHKHDSEEKTDRLELNVRLDTLHESGEPQIAFDASGSAASADIIEWRGSVSEGEVGRFAPESTHIEFQVRNVTRPFTFLHEDRLEFRNQSYTFAGEKMASHFDRVLKHKLKQLDEILAETEAEPDGHAD